MLFPLHELCQFILFAQENGAGGAADGGADGGAGGAGGGGGGGLFGDPMLLMLIMGVMVLFYFMVARPQRQKQKEAQKMLENLKENDQVVTVGGIVGSIVSFSKDKSEVVIRTDEKSNTKMRVLRSHIARPLAMEDETQCEPQDLGKS